MLKITSFLPPSWQLSRSYLNTDSFVDSDSAYIITATDLGLILMMLNIKISITNLINGDQVVKDATHTYQTHERLVRTNQNVLIYSFLCTRT